MRNAEQWGSPDPRGERMAQKSQKETLNVIEGEVGEEAYKEIIAKLASDEPLSKRELNIVRQLKEKLRRKEH